MLYLFPGEDELAVGNPGHEDDGGVVVYSSVEEVGVCGESCDLSKSGSFQLRGKIPVERLTAPK